MEQISKNKPLKPVLLSIPILQSHQANHPYPYEIIDGIHRIEALRRNGFTYVLAGVIGIPVCERPFLPPRAAQHYEKLKVMILNETAATLLSGAGKLNIGNVFMFPLRSNVIKFSILRNGKDIGNVCELPPDCELTVFLTPDPTRDEIMIHVTAKIVSSRQVVEEREYNGTVQDVSWRILSDVQLLLHVSI